MRINLRVHPRRRFITINVVASSKWVSPSTFPTRTLRRYQWMNSSHWLLTLVTRNRWRDGLRKWDRQYRRLNRRRWDRRCKVARVKGRKIKWKISIRRIIRWRVARRI
jgi:hypothetical protein